MLLFGVAGFHGLRREMRRRGGRGHEASGVPDMELRECAAVSLVEERLCREAWGEGKEELEEKRKKGTTR